jgi:predicted kinase
MKAFAHGMYDTETTKYVIIREALQEKNILILQGLPASGKTTLRKMLTATDYVSKDEIRKINDFMHGDPTDEQRTHRMLVTQLIGAMIRNTPTIIIDNTNFREQSVMHYIEIARAYGYGYSIIFADTPLHECLRRNTARQNVVPEAFIVKLYGEAVKQGYYTEEKRQKKPALLVDIDGTIANTDHRSHLAKTKQWELFFERQLYDTPNTDIIDLYKALAHVYDLDVLLLSGRPEHYRSVTVNWLTQHNIPYRMLLLRPDNDVREDYIVKQAIYQQSIAPYYAVRYVLEDRTTVVAMWRSLGLRCLQVADGNF